MPNAPDPIFDPEASNSAISTIQALNIEVALVAEIKELLKPILPGYAINTVSIQSGSPLFQVAVGLKPSNISEVSYPPEEVVINPGHKPNERFFYGYSSREVAIAEAGVKVGDTLTVGFQPLL